MALFYILKNPSRLNVRNVFEATAKTINVFKVEVSSLSTILYTANCQNRAVPKKKRSTVLHGKLMEL